MNRVTKYTLLFVVIVVVLGVAGRHDYNEAVIYNMPDSVYEVMQEKMGHPSDSRLVDEYTKDKKYWDSVAFDCEYK